VLDYEREAWGAFLQSSTDSNKVGSSMNHDGPVHSASETLHARVRHGGARRIFFSFFFFSLLLRRPHSHLLVHAGDRPSCGEELAANKDATLSGRAQHVGSNDGTSSLQTKN
jgi:hypothetical protein